MTAITITATLTDEQALILAKEKGYSETVSTPVDATVVPMTFTSAPNTETPFEFLKRVYQAIIISDAQKHYLERDARLYREQRLIEEESIKQSVVEAITSSVG